MPTKSKKRTEAARRNGAKSKGPKTAAGKKRSSRNSLKHGLSAAATVTILLPGEDPHKLQQITNAIYQKLRPKDHAEAALIDIMIAQLWRGNRILSYESQLMCANAEDLHPELAETYKSISIDRLMALSYQDLRPDTLTPLNRYMATARNMFKTALIDLERLRKLEGDPEKPFIAPRPIESTTTTLCLDTDKLEVTGAAESIIQREKEKEHTPPKEEHTKEQPAPHNEPKPEPEPPPKPEPKPPAPEPKPEPKPEPALILFVDAKGNQVDDMNGNPIYVPNPKSNLWREALGDKYKPITKADVEPAKTEAWYLVR